MKTISNSPFLVVLPLLLTLTSSLTLDISSQTIANTLSKFLNLHGPSIPYGFSMSVIQNASNPINTNDTYICAIEAMYHWATSSSWDDETQHHSDHSEIVRGLQVSYRDVPNQPVRIKWSHLIISILTAVNTMDKYNPNPHHVFSETTVEMKQDEKLFGFLKIGKPPADGTTAKADQANDSTATAKRDELNVDNTKAAPPPNTHPSKTITDTTESGPINITYQRFGHSAPCTLLFSTALDGIAYAAADDFGDTWTYSTCYDWSKKMMYQTVQVKIGDGGSAWTADLIKRVARLLPERLFEEGGCGEVRFRVELEGYGRVGTGGFQVVEFVGGGGGM